MDGVKYSYIIAYILWDGCIDEWMDGWSKIFVHNSLHTVEWMNGWKLDSVKYSYIAYILWDGWMV